MTLGQMIKSLRISKNLTQEQLVQICSVDRSFISKVEHDKHIPKHETLKSIAVALEVDPMSLVYIDIVEADDSCPERIKRIVELFPEQLQEYWLQALEGTLAAMFKL